jgi:hypothetical protein
MSFSRTFRAIQSVSCKSLGKPDAQIHLERVR